jgi:hypothetical protein
MQMKIHKVQITNLEPSKIRIKVFNVQEQKQEFSISKRKNKKPSTSKFAKYSNIQTRAFQL